jgi:flagellar basal body rod protein FlgF
MARINGINSDYRMIGGKIQEVLPPPANLELKLFICPTAQPNGLEAEAATCNGQNTTCPSAHVGHALLHMHQVDGIKLVTDNGNMLQLNQAGVIALSPPTKVQVTSPLEVVKDGQTITVTPSGTGVLVQHTGGSSIRFKSNGTLEITTGGQTVTISGSGSGMDMLHPNGSKVTFKSNGGMDLVTNNNTGTVTIQGNLVVSGTLTRNGSPV